MCLQVPLWQGVRGFTREMSLGYDISLRDPCVVDLQDRELTGWITSDDIEGVHDRKCTHSLYCVVLRIECRVSIVSHKRTTIGIFQLIK